MKDLIYFIEHQIKVCGDSKIMENEKWAFELVLEKAKKEELTLTDATQQRELLLAYNKEVNQCMIDSQDILEESDVDEFLANYNK